MKHSPNLTDRGAEYKGKEATHIEQLFRSRARPQHNARVFLGTEKEIDLRPLYGHREKNKNNQLEDGPDEYCSIEVLDICLASE